MKKVSKEKLEEMVKTSEPRNADGRCADGRCADGRC